MEVAADLVMELGRAHRSGERFGTDQLAIERVRIEQGLIIEDNIIDANDRIVSDLTDMEKSWAKSSTYLAKNISIPDFLDIGSTINTIKVDSNGYVIIFLNYGVRNNGGQI